MPDDLGVILRSNGNTSKKGMGEAQQSGRELYPPKDSSGVDIVKLML